MTTTPRSVAPRVAPECFSATIGELVAQQGRAVPDAVAIEEGVRSWTYRELADRSARMAGVLRGCGVRHGDRVAVLSENRHEYLELEVAAATIGAITACLNWRLAPVELEHCVRLVEPTAVVVSPRFESMLAGVEHGVERVLRLGPDLEALLAAERPGPTGGAEPVDLEDGLLILYTSGTTGLPKGAMISHRALLARAGIFAALTAATPDDAFVAWAPMFHMASTDHSLITLMLGGRVVVCDGLDLPAIRNAVTRHRISWLVAMPGMIEQLLGALVVDGPPVRGIGLVGAMADLVPRRQIAELTRLLDCPYANTFGSTECGLAPASANRIAVGDAPASLPKRQTPLGLVRLVDPDDRDVPDGTPGELIFRGPTLFSGYWAAPETNAEDFRGGWFHTGDSFVRNADGTLDFVDRVKYMIKSGGENVYPAVIERLLLADDRVADAVVVRRQDERWGEVPVAVVARADAAELTAEDLLNGLHGRLAGYEMPKDVHFVAEVDFPRSTTGKIQRHEIENWVR